MSEQQSPPKEKRRRWPWIVIGVPIAILAFLVILGLIVGPQDRQSADGPIATTASPAATASATSSTTEAPAPPSSTAAPAETEPPGGRMNALFCKFTTYEGGPYYVQVFNPTVPGEGMCTASEQSYTQEEFGDIPGLKRRCSLDRSEQIAQKKAIVSIYSDGTPESVQAARLMCSNTKNSFTE